MSLKVKVVGATDLPNIEWPFSKSDPRCILTFRKEEKRTSVKQSTLKPIWDETKEWVVKYPLGSTDVLNVGVYDHEPGGWHRPLGFIDLPLGELISQGKMTVDKPLQTKAGVRMRVKPENAKIQLELTYMPPPQRPVSKAVAVKGVGQLDGAGGEAETDLEEPSDQTPWSAIEEEQVRYYAKKRKAQKLANKPMDFQVRVHVIEGRKIEGVQVNPVVKVVCGRDTNGTNSQKATNNPYFDKKLFFNIHERPEEMMDRVVDIQVMDAKKVRKNALIGSFKFDLRLVYNEPEHCFVHKWLLLTNPKDTGGAVKGYLKISIIVIAPGDEPKHSPSYMSPENVDIESNLLRPLGVQLQPAILTIKIYRAEHLPQMDPDYLEKVKKLIHVGREQKQLVDPYCTVSYGGHKGETHVLTNDTHPHWNYQVNMGVRFPSMCERIQFQLMDRDIASQDDYIGTCYLNMSQISVIKGHGFLPTFGPCFLNIYGSPREYSHLPDKYEYLNKGMIEGVAYRGRVLVEVSMSVKEDHGPDDEKEHQFTFDEKWITPLLKKRNFKLLAVFFSATMIHPADAPVEFEVSIGNYGNKLEQEESELAVNSTTPEKNPIHYGNSYYFISWRNHKPCVVVDSEWEDSVWRIEMKNMLLFIADRLERGIFVTRKAMEQKSRKSGEQFEATVEQFLEDILELSGERSKTVYFVPLPKEGYTDLDRRKKEYRESELTSLKKAAKHLIAKTCFLTLEQKLEECEEYLSTLRELAMEPQNSVPDVILWMLAGGKRVASYRIPSHLLMYSGVAKKRGRNCGKLQTIHLTPPAVEKDEDLKDLKDRALLRVLLWLGPEEDSSHYIDELAMNVEDKVASYAETYERETFVGVMWTDKLMGSVEKAKKPFETPPDGWEWKGMWYISPELSIDFDPEIGQSEWEEEIFENQSRVMVFGKWPHPEKSYWTDVRGEKIIRYEDEKKKELTKDDIKCPEGWEWKEDSQWQVDKRRVTDKDGWEYSIEAGLGNWGPSESRLHFSRRRRWTRERIRSKDAKTVYKRIKSSHEKEGWEYARPGTKSYHVTEHALDMLRRRRWLKRLKRRPDYHSQPPVFHIKGKEQLARVYLSYEESDCNYYQLRVHLYQARDMYSSDRSGLSDPYILISFDHYSAKSLPTSETVTPTWDQTILIQNIEIFGDPSVMFESPPPVVLEFYDKDKVGANEFLGRVECTPTVKGMPQLDWYEITRYNKPAGELLAAFELRKEDHILPDWPRKTDIGHPECFMVPFGIRPVPQPMRVEVLCWGVRDMKRYQFLRVTKPYVEVECGGFVLQNKALEDGSKDPNFPTATRIISFDPMIPINELHSPPLNIHLYENRTFGRTPLIGSCLIKSLHKHLVQNDAQSRRKSEVQLGISQASSSPARDHMAITIEPPEAVSIDPEASNGLEFDWWSKYYWSTEEKNKVQKGYEEAGLGKLKVYRHELEKEYNFSDLVETFPLFRGKGSREETTEQVVGYLKGVVKMYRLDPQKATPPPSIFTNFPSSHPMDVVVRVYIIKGIDFQPLDPDKSSDPYIKVSVGKNEINDRDQYIPGDLNPIFGRMYELPATLPQGRNLTITVMDWDRVTADDLIGSTRIDLEDRYLTMHRARCGLPESYHVNDPFMWRDQESPEAILTILCQMHNLPLPYWAPNKTGWVEVDNMVIKPDNEEEDTGLEGSEKWKVAHQRLALKALHETKLFDLVPEHVETRELYNPLYPGVPQGALHMWVDIFQKDLNISNPVDISPRRPHKYVLRVVVYNVKDVLEFGDVNIVGEEMNDLYVKGWLRGQEETQRTDVHYRSMDGEGNFNWRLVFPFEYNPIEQTMVIRQKEHLYSLALTEKVIPGAPLLTLQIKDNDIFSPDEFLGSIEMNLSCMPKPVRLARNCGVDKQLFEHQGGSADLSSGVDLLRRKRTIGWWPVTKMIEVEGEEGLVIVQNGKLELQLEILMEEQAQIKPAGKGREEPNLNPHLEEPNRPATSFLWIASPWKTFKFIIWEHWKLYIIGAILLILLVIMVAVFVYTAPSSFMQWLFDSTLP